MTHLFSPDFDDLPKTLSVFPLSGSLLFPKRTITIEVATPSHIQLVLDALGENRMFGVIQRQHSQIVGEPETYAVGCAGRISSFREASNARLIVGLTGVCRFSVTGELQDGRSYRRVLPNWMRFRGDMKPGMAPLLVDVESLEDRVKAYCAAKSLSMQSSSFNDIPPDELVDLLVAQLPLGLEEKQALLESTTLPERLALLEAFLDMGGQRSGVSAGAPTH